MKSFNHKLALGVLLLSVILLITKPSEGFNFGPNSYYRDSDINPEFVSDYVTSSGLNVDTNKYMDYNQTI
jgi:hypothetical protein